MPGKAELKVGFEFEGSPTSRGPSALVLAAVIPNRSAAADRNEVKILKACATLAKSQVLGRGEVFLDTVLDTLSRLQLLPAIPIVSGSSDDQVVVNRLCVVRVLGLTHISAILVVVGFGGGS